MQLNVPIPDSPGNGVDGFLPLIEHIKDLGGVFLIKWDGERDTRHYTAVVSHAGMETCRADDHTIERATASAILSFANAVINSSTRDP